MYSLICTLYDAQNCYICPKSVTYHAPLKLVCCHKWQLCIVAEWESWDWESEVFWEGSDVAIYIVEQNQKDGEGLWRTKEEVASV